ncbi:hypothetical protein [Clostridium sp.]|jgi:hypothetical protein|uniref:hypothetical protein n=1 Tax=Clostridium sp. TaxID=1506 RepID=UPI0025C1A03E|nr:hypothetical protein [Clostridium sp.]MCI9070219.1 hypothetical protein [Clostridium sp.]
MKKIKKATSEIKKLISGFDFIVCDNEIIFNDGYYNFKIIADDDSEEYVLNIEDIRNKYNCDGVHYEHIKSLQDVIYKWAGMIHIYFKKSEQYFLSLCSV